MRAPSVSVVIPLHNKAKYILETIESVRQQTADDWEAVVVDNLSTDEGPSIVRSLGDPRIRVISCEREGVSAARNTGTQAACGKWVVFLDADDLLKPCYIQTQLESASASDANLVVCCYEEFDNATPDRITVKRPVYGEFTVQKLRDSSIVYCPGPQHIFMVHRALLRNHIRWPEHLDKLLGEDTCFWFHVISLAEIAFNPKAVARYRIWAPGSRFTDLSNPAHLFRGIGQAVTENLAFLSEQRRKVSSGQAEMLARFNYGIYRDARDVGEREVAKAALQEAQWWLAHYFSIATRPTWAMRVRGLLGLPLFAMLFDRSTRIYARR